MLGCLVTHGLSFKIVGVKFKTLDIKESVIQTRDHHQGDIQKKKKEKKETDNLMIDSKGNSTESLVIVS